MESLDPADLDEQAEVEVDKVLDEVLQGTFGGVGRIKGKNTEKKEEAEEVDDSAEVDAMKARMEKLHQ